MTHYLLNSVVFVALLALVGCSGAPLPGEDEGSDDGQESSGEALSFKRSKRDYCCIKKALDVVGTERVATCKRIRDYRDELGRASARVKCEGFNIDLTSPSVGFGAAPGSPVNHDLVGATCEDRAECLGVHLE